MKKFICGLFKHHIRRHARSSFVKSRYESIHVADELIEERFSCLCKRENSGWQEVDRSGINSLTMSSDRWALFRRDGKLPPRII